MRGPSMPRRPCSQFGTVVITLGPTKLTLHGATITAFSMSSGSMVSS